MSPAEEDSDISDGHDISDGRRWALVGGTIIDPGQASVARGGILIDQGLIVGAGPDVHREGLGDIPVVDVAGRFVMPGLIDTHIHLAFDGGPRPIERFLDDGIDAGFVARLADFATTALRSGVTAIRDLGGPNEELFALRDRIERRGIDGPRLIAAGLVLAPPAGHCHFIGRLTDGVDLARAAAVQLDEGADCIKVMVTGGVHTPGSSSADVYFGLDDLKSAAVVAHRAGRRITGHATNKNGIERAVLAGFDSVQHGSALDADLAAMMADHGVVLVPTLGTHAAMREHHGDPRIPSYVAAKSDQGIAGKARAFQAAVEAGVRIAAGTDGGVTFVGHGSLARELLLFRESGLGPMETLAAATSMASEEVGMADRIGRLTAGYAADILVLDADPLVDLHALDHPDLIIRGGAVVRAAMAARSPVSVTR